MFKVSEQILKKIGSSKYISRDLSWMRFNDRVLDQAKKPGRTIFEKLKFLAITASNLDEFFMIRMGSLYNYIDYGKERIDFSGLREQPFKKRLLEETHRFVENQVNCFESELRKEFISNGFNVSGIDELDEEGKKKTEEFFDRTLFPMLTPMVYDNYHSFPVLMNQILVFAVQTRSGNQSEDQQKISFIQIPKNIPRFLECEQGDILHFVPIEEVIRSQISKLYRNVVLESVKLMRVTRNGDFTLEESDDLEVDFIDELKHKLKTRRTGRVVRLEIEPEASKEILKVLTDRWDLDEENIFSYPSLIDFTCLWQIVGHNAFKDKIPKSPHMEVPLSLQERKTKEENENIFSLIKGGDILLHHPYNSINPVIDLLETSAEDENVLAIKITIYRLAKNSRVTNALLKAAEAGKHVSVLFEVKARFDEENNLREAQRLQKAGVFVIYGMTALKTHTKLLLIVRKEGQKISRYVHLGSGNYNESTSKLYTDIGILTNDEVYAQDVSEFFNVITGHSEPQEYKNLLTAPRDMRNKLLELIKREAEHAKQGLTSGICIKINSLQDTDVMDALYEASQAGVSVKLIIRGICCLRPGREGLSENITVRSVVGDFLEHSRIYYFHNNGDPLVLGGSADIMIRSFDRRIESLFAITDPFLKKEAINSLVYNLNDNVNAYELQEDGSYTTVDSFEGLEFDIHKEFYNVKPMELEAAKLF